MGNGTRRSRSSRRSSDASGRTDQILSLIRCLRLDLSDEKRTQAGIAEALSARGIEFERECRLGPGDVIDFLAGDVGIEVKLRGARKMDVYRQLVRYAQHERVRELVLVSNVSMGLPELIEGKPAYYVSLGQAWL